MKIEIKSNRNLIIKIISPLLIMGIICAIITAIIMSVDPNLPNDIFTLALYCSFVVLMSIIMIIIKFHKGKRYEFTESKIFCYRRKKLLKTIIVSDIEKIEFIKYRLKNYISDTLIGWLTRGHEKVGKSWKLHVHYKDGTFETLGFLSPKQAEMLKEQLFGDLLTIIYL